MIKYYSHKRYLNSKNKKLDKVKADLRFLKKEEDLAKKIREEIRNLRSDIIDIKSGISDTDPVQGGGSTQEDRYCKALDEVMELERLLTMIDLDTRALKQILKTIDDEDYKLINDLWIEEITSLRNLAPTFNMSKDTAKRKSDKVLLYIFEELYIKTPKDVYPN